MIKIQVSEDKEFDLEAQTKIDRVNIDVEAANQPSMYAYVAVLAEEASADAKRAKLHLEVLAAELDKEKRAQQLAANQKVTDKHTEQLVKLDPRYQQARSDLIEAERKAGILKAAESAFGIRTPMIKGLIEIHIREKGYESQMGKVRREM